MADENNKYIGCVEVISSDKVSGWGEYILYSNKLKYGGINHA